MRGFQNTFLSNMFEVPVEYEGRTYKSSEAAFQAAKTLDKDARKEFELMDGWMAKRYGRKLKLRPRWDNIKLGVMRDILKSKFRTGRMARALLATLPHDLEETLTWHDNFWGNCVCGRVACLPPGKNHLGILLMELRASIEAERKEHEECDQ